MNLTLDTRFRIGTTLPLLPDAAATPGWQWRMDDLRQAVELIDRCGYDSVWAPDHIVMTVPIIDPMLQLAQAAVMSRRLLVGTGVYLPPLRSAGAVAKLASTLDQLSEGRFIFGVGVGGEHPREWQLTGTPVSERGARMTECIEVMRKLWTGEPVSHAGRFANFADIPMLPRPFQPGGPPIWCGGRADAALKRAAEIADGYMSYLITPKGFGEALVKMEGFAAAVGREHPSFGTSHLLFACIAESVEKAGAIVSSTLSHRYKADFSKPTQRYAALGRPNDVAERIREFHAAGVRHLVVDFSYAADEGRAEQIERFAAEVMPLIADLR